MINNAGFTRRLNISYQRTQLYCYHDGHKKSSSVKSEELKNMLKIFMSIESDLSASR